ncbi:Amino acid-binding ACT [Ectocarpus siliculosus]|uniref:Amino acid-binding ACT n=1 Tax=Ectocarpus siliculosus TaxID=2880 RepID=D7G881_ECTSI|nr:Amino acid-binding ACT [Ectocarpus siliculosus]|eukprot:CBJ27944.1 Amino acid-binding ACT [Ectocarpus siliculosus]
MPAGARTNNTAGTSLPETAGHTSRNISVESRAMAQECSVEYLQQGLRASLAHILGVTSGSSTPTEAGTIPSGTALPENAGLRAGLAHILGVASGSSTPAEAGTITAGTTLPETAGRKRGDIAVESRTMAQECSVEYLQQGLRASLASIIGVDPRSSTPKEDIVERRASLKPVTTAQLTPMEAKMGDGESEVASRLQREWGVEQEARDRAAALLELTALVRAKALNRYDPGDFSREVVFGEGRHSVVYRVSATRSCGATGRLEDHPCGRPATKGAMLREAAATMAREVSTAILAAAETAVVSMKETNVSKVVVAEETTVVMMMAAALVESVIRTSSSAVVIPVTAVASRENDKNIGTVLAAKEFRYTRADAPESILRQAHREVCMHLRVSDCAHVVAVRGVWVLPRVTILLEPMHGGNLHGFLRARVAEDDERKEGHETRRQRARLVSEAADGLAALHHAGIVHRDVKSHNVLVVRQRQTAFGGAEPVVVRGREHGESDHNCTFLEGIDESGWEAKLGDLGSAALIPLEGQAALTEEIGTSGWTAPEVCEGRGYGTPADVFSLGVLIWDAFVCGALENPMCGRSGDQLTGRLRPRWPQAPFPVVPSDIERLAERCWAPDPEARPTAGAVAAELRAFCCRACVEIDG